MNTLLSTMFNTIVLKTVIKVELNVYDILGRKVRELYNDIAPVGIISIDFKADDLASGMYVYQLKTKDYSISKKMVLLK
jgi:hypothetical protein